MGCEKDLRWTKEQRKQAIVWDEILIFVLKEKKKKVSSSVKQGPESKKKELIKMLPVTWFLHYIISQWCQCICWIYYNCWWLYNYIRLQYFPTVWSYKKAEKNKQ